MKETFALIIILLSSTLVIGQTKLNTKPFIIQGQITGCPEKYLRLFIRDINGQSVTDTINLDKSGKFYLETFKVQAPQRASIQKNNIQINDFFVAPGYNLTITGNGNDFFSLNKSKNISGIGSESNKYRFMLDSIVFARMEPSGWFQLNENDLLSYIKNNKKLKDSIAHVVFDKSPIEDEFLKYFGSLVQLDNEFYKLILLVSYANLKNYHYEKSISFVRDNFDNRVLDNLYKDEYLISNDYRDGFIGAAWLTYLINLDYQKDSTLKNQKGYKLKKVNEVYKGKVKELVLFKLMTNSITNTGSFETLNDNKEQFATYILSLDNKYYKNSLETKFSEKEAELLRTQVGKPAPSFTLQSNSGTTYRLEDFKNKVVYLDLWASWCGPCRAETPNFKILYNKYKKDKRVVFLSIAVHDGINQWKKALEEDKPQWIQLIDQEGLVWKSYVANTIPKFILIDKQGNIVNFDAPRPSDREEIEKLLNQEIVK
ncbi:MAG TPA: TlpA disulfide reductase family protein [Ferruginibacter sp.]|nr:TlpA disulfide reductase family protein [Ferruginibacter sp.]